MAKIADLIVSLSADVAQFRTSMADSAQSVKTLGESFEDAKKKVGELVEFLAVAEGVKFIKEAVDATEEWAFSIQKLTQLTGQSSESAATFAAVAREEGVSTDVVTTAISRLSLALATHPQKFKELGIAVRDAQGQLLPMQQILANTTKGLDEFKVGADRDAAASLLLGKGFANLLPDLQRLAPELTGPNWEKARQLIEGLGLAIDEHGIAKAREWEKAEADLGLAFLAIQNQIGQALLPLLTNLGTGIARLASDGSLKKWANEAGAAITGLTIDLAELADFFVSHNQIFGSILAIAGGAAVFEAPTVAGRAAGFAALAAGWKATGDGADEASAKSHEALQKMIADLKGVQASFEPVQAAFTALSAHVPVGPTSDSVTSAITGKPDTDGTKTFTPPPTAAAESAAEKFQKLTTELTAQRAEQDALSEAWKRGGVEAQGITDRFDAFKASLALGKDNTDAQRAAIDKLSLSVKNAAEQAKLNEQVSKFSVTATDQVQFQKDLSAAYAAGGVAVESITAKEKAHQAVLALGLNATQAAKSAVEALSLAESQATNDAKRTETLAKSSELLQENTAYQGRLTEAYREGGRSVLAIEDSEKAYQAVLALGKNATAEQIAQVTQLSLANSAATRLTAQAATANQDLIGSLKEAGGAFETAFTSALKPGSDMLALLKSLGEQLEDIVLKATIFKPLERELDSFLNGTNSTGSGSTGGTGIAGAIAKLFSGSSSAPSGAQPNGGTVQGPDFTSLITNGFEDSGTALTDIMGKAFQDDGTQTQVSTTFGQAFQSNQGLLSNLFGAIFSSIESLFSSGAGSSGGGFLSGLFSSGAGAAAGAAASSVRAPSTNLGNPVSSSSFRPPDVRGSAASAAPEVHIHGVTNPEKATVNHKQKATGGYDIEVYLADSVAKNIRSGGKIAQAQRDTFGNSRVAIQR